MKKIIPVMVIGLILCSLVGLTGCFDNRDDFKTVNILITDAPFGKYWVHSYGSIGGFIFFHGYFDSNLQESYTIKYMEGNELKTLILSSMDSRLHVILTDDNTSMHMDILVHMYSNDGLDSPSPFGYMNHKPSSSGIVYTSPDSWTYKYTFNLFIPRPEICSISNEVID